MFAAPYFFLRRGSASGFPGPKCLRMTSGSLSLGFSMRTPAFAASAVTKKFVFGQLPESNHGRRGDSVLAKRAMPLRDDHAVCGCVFNRYGALRQNGQFLS